MKISIDWGGVNKLTAEFELSEMKEGARYLTAVCETRCMVLGVNELTLEVALTNPMNTFIHNYLSSELFKLEVVRDDETGPIPDDRLIYNRLGWEY